MESLQHFIDDAKNLSAKADIDSGWMEFHPENYRRKASASAYTSSIDTKEGITMQIPKMRYAIIADGHNSLAIDVKTSQIEFNAKQPMLPYPILMKRAQTVIDKYNAAVAATSK